MDTGEIATELLDALDRQRVIPTITGRDPAFDVDAGYRVAAEILRRRRARGEQPVGRKVGFTNRTIWAEYGVSSPMWAHVYDSTVSYWHEPSGRIRISRLSQPRLEPEIIFHLKSTPRETADERELLSHVDWIAHGCEIVQSHFPDWSFRAGDAVAAFGLHGVLVVGPRRPVGDLRGVESALRTFSITLDRPGRPTAHGRGADVLGSPLLAIAHLLAMLQNQPQFEPLRAGELVTTGTLLPPPPICAGETWTTALSGLDLPGLHLEVTA